MNGKILIINIVLFIVLLMAMDGNVKAQMVQEGRARMLFVISNLRRNEKKWGQPQLSRKLYGIIATLMLSNMSNTECLTVDMDTTCQ